jgi:hypothetical protein
MSLCEKYRPLKIADFIGLSKPKLILQKLAANPDCPFARRGSVSGSSHASLL